MSQRALFILMLGLTLILGACTMKFGTDFNPKSFHDWVKRGETTRSQVIEYLGTPTSEGSVILGDGTQLKRMLYYYGDGKLHNMENAKFKMLEVRFDSSNKVYSFNYSTSE